MKKRSGFSMIELVFVIVILGVLAAVAVPRFVATRTDAQVATARSDLASAMKAVVAKVFADNIDATQSCAPHPNTPASQVTSLGSCTAGTLTVGSAITWGDWILEVSGMDRGRWGVVKDTSGMWGSLSKEDAIQPIGNMKTHGTSTTGKGGCGGILAVVTTAVTSNNVSIPKGSLAFDPSNINKSNAGNGDNNSDFCNQLSNSYKNSSGNGNRIIPLASTGTVEF